MKISKASPKITHLLFVDDLLFCKADIGQIRCLKHTLEDYEMCSGQKVNIEKSSIFFSKNAPFQLKEQICRELEGIKVQTKSKYLGLPFVIGRSKAQVFKYIDDTTEGNISSWMNKFLSSAGKEILLKSMVMALSNYTISCYKPSNSLCKKIKPLVGEKRVKRRRLQDGIS